MIPLVRVVCFLLGHISPFLSFVIWLSLSASPFLLRVDSDASHSSKAYAAHERGHPRKRVRLIGLVSLRLSAFVGLFMSHSRSPFFSVFCVLFYFTTITSVISLGCFWLCHSHLVR